MPLPFSLSMESTSYVLSSRVVFFYLVNTSWIFDMSLCESSTKKKWSAEQEKCVFPCHRSRLRIWSRETGSAVPFRVSLFILHTQAESVNINIH